MKKKIELLLYLAILTYLGVNIKTAINDSEKKVDCNKKIDTEDLINRILNNEQLKDIPDIQDIINLLDIKDLSIDMIVNSNCVTSLKDILLRIIQEKIEEDGQTDIYLQDLELVKLSSSYGLIDEVQIKGLTTDGNITVKPLFTNAPDVIRLLVEKDITNKEDIALVLNAIVQISDSQAFCIQYGEVIAVNFVNTKELIRKR